jgi:uncharacterized protein YjbI with pentapeptide repeats
MLHDQSSTKRLRFNLRSVLVWVAVIALLIGSYTSVRRERIKNVRLTEQLLIARSEIRLAEDRFEIQTSSSNTSNTKGELSNTRLEGAILTDAVIKGGDQAFQRTVFDNSDLSNASLIGGVSAFQAASFNNATLKNAKLIGGAASFQLAKFENADLSAAVLTGNLQGISLRNANCKGATIKGRLQSANLDAAHFENADMSGVNGEDLGSCYHDTRPTYDVDTKFPDGFDPVAHGWRKTN